MEEKDQDSKTQASDVIDHPSVQPLDDHNRRWAAHVHPTDWVNPEPPTDERYNLVVIGAGPAGLVTRPVSQL